MFPSPSGVLCFSIVPNDSDQRLYPYIVSVPSRGSVFLNHETKKTQRSEKRRFRPLPGFCVSQSESPYVKACHAEFPSPSGVLCFSMLCTRPFGLTKPGFRPLPGFCVSQCAGKRFQRKFGVRVSVPFRGSVFLNPSGGFTTVT